MKVINLIVSVIWQKKMKMALITSAVKLSHVWAVNGGLGQTPFHMNKPCRWLQKIFKSQIRPNKQMDVMGKYRRVDVDKPRGPRLFGTWRLMGLMGRGWKDNR